MATKPSVLYLHDSSGTHIVTPTSGHQASGWANDEVPGSGEVNGYWQNWTQFLQYLNDGNFTGGISIAGGLTVTGGLTTDTLNITSRATAKKKLNPIVGFQSPLNSNGLGNISATPFALFMLDIPVGAVITQILGWFNKASSGSSTLSFATGAWGNDPTTFTTAFPAPADLVTSVGSIHEMQTAAGTYTAVSGTFPYIALSSSVADDFVCGAEVWFTPPSAL